MRDRNSKVPRVDQGHVKMSHGESSALLINDHTSGGLPNMSRVT